MRLLNIPPVTLLPLLQLLSGVHATALSKPDVSSTQSICVVRAVDDSTPICGSSIDAICALPDSRLSPVCMNKQVSPPFTPSMRRRRDVRPRHAHQCKPKPLTGHENSTPYPPAPTDTPHYPEPTDTPHPTEPTDTPHPTEPTDTPHPTEPTDTTPSVCVPTGESCDVDGAGCCSESEQCLSNPLGEGTICTTPPPPCVSSGASCEAGGASCCSESEQCLSNPLGEGTICTTPPPPCVSSGASCEAGGASCCSESEQCLPIPFGGGSMCTTPPPPCTPSGQTCDLGNPGTCCSLCCMSLVGGGPPSVCC